MSSLEIIGSRDSHNALRRTLADRAPCKILDVPAGTGVLASFLIERGWEVHCADIDRGNFELENVPFETVNLNRTLPHEDNSFDAIVCANGLHRIYNVRGALDEFRRILKPNGTLYINVNNYSSIDKRFRFLFYGSLDNAVNQAGCRQTIDDPEAHIRNNLLYPQLANLLAAAGFEVRGRWASAVRPAHLVLTPIAWLLRAFALLIPPKSRRRSHVGACNSGPLLPGGRYMLIEATKEVA